MNVPVTVNGITVEIPVDDEVIHEALKKKKKETGYEKVVSGNYYLAGPTSTKVCTETNYNTISDIGSFNIANYYSDKNVAKNNIRADTLMRQLRRFAAECDGAVAPYANYGFVIFWNRVTCALDCGHDVSSTTGVIRFKTRAAAQLAILEFKDELEWYFTEYDPMPSGWWDN